VNRWTKSIRVTMAAGVVWAAAGVLFAQPRIGVGIGYPGPYGGYISVDSSLRILVQPKNAAVYVDGYFAGLVDEFDGVFQRLHVTPGRHEIVIFLDGYRSLHQQLYLSPNGTTKISGTLERLGPGEPGEAAPHPLEPPDTGQGAGVRGLDPRWGGPRGPRPRGPVEPEDADASRGRHGPVRGTLSLRVQPAATDVTIDGQPWAGPDDDTRLLVPLADGRHVVEVRKRGYRGFVTEIDVRNGQTVPLNISLTPEP
jgi:hypothetical protein